MAILKDDWQLYNSLTLCDDSKKGVRTELRRWELHLSHLEQREISSIKKLDLARLRCHLEKKNLSPSCSRRNLRHEDNAFIRQAYGLRAALFFPAHRMYAPPLAAPKGPSARFESAS